ncbi:MAG: alpha-amylase family glycosyl hydrolase [Prevotella sp.]|nr:alpha-amylase family glycosyl hydrolase [Bacteroides sp.]MCM1365828.1 alpha-amylase family glycosyl hydrolase [Prevotella sp.]
MNPDPNKERLVIYQVFPRIFTNTNDSCVRGGTLEQNGSGHLNDYTPKLLKSIKNLGVNAVWFTGIIECATKTGWDSEGIPADNPNVVKGQAGSPYAIKDYYDVCPAISENVNHRMAEFEDLVERVHNEGMKVLIDFVPNHTARVYHSDSSPEGVEDFGKGDDITYFFKPSNNYYYNTNQLFSPDFPLDAEGDVPYVEFPAKATGNDCFTAFCTRNDWYETVKLNYGHDYGDNSDHFNPVPDTWLKMRDILLYWAGKGVDGFRCDMVFMVPLAFWHWVIPQVKKKHPGIIFIGEIYDVGLYRSFLEYGCFDYLYDKVNLYDTLVGIERHGVSAARLTGTWQTVEGISDKMLNFLENHDEVRFGSDEFAGDPIKVLPYLVASSMISSSPYMIYYGQEFGESAKDNEGFAGDNHRTTIFDYWSYASMRRWYNDGNCDGARFSPHEKWLREVYTKVLTLLNSESALRYGAFFDLMYVNLQNPDFNPHSTYAFLRYSEDEKLLIVCNFSDAPAEVKVNIPSLAYKMAKLPIGKCSAEDLLSSVTKWTSGKTEMELYPDKVAALSVGSKSAVVLKLMKLNEDKLPTILIDNR